MSEENRFHASNRACVSRGAHASGRPPAGTGGEADSVRAELAEMDTLASQTEAAIYRLLSSVLAQAISRLVCRQMPN